MTKLEDLKPLTLFVSKEGMPTYFQWLKSEYGFSEANVKPSRSIRSRFLADKQERDAGLRHLGAVCGGEGRGLQADDVLCWPTMASTAYSTLIETRRDRRRQASPTWCSASSMPRSSAGTIIIYGDNSSG